jgi:hypothetical protein
MYKLQRRIKYFSLAMYSKFILSNTVRESLLVLQQKNVTVSFSLISTGNPTIYFLLYSAILVVYSGNITSYVGYTVKFKKFRHLNILSFANCIREMKTAIPIEISANLGCYLKAYCFRKSQPSGVYIFY